MASSTTSESPAFPPTEKQILEEYGDPNLVGRILSRDTSDKKPCLCSLCFHKDKDSCELRQGENPLPLSGVTPVHPDRSCTKWTRFTDDTKEFEGAVCGILTGSSI